MRVCIHSHLPLPRVAVCLLGVLHPSRDPIWYSHMSRLVRSSSLSSRSTVVTYELIWTAVVCYTAHPRVHTRAGHWHRYVGEVQEGQRHGRGTLYYADGSMYEGTWRHGRKDGQGVHVSYDVAVWAGTWVDDCPGEGVDGDAFSPGPHGLRLHV